MVMEEQLLNEILRDTYTLESFKRRSIALKLHLEEKIFKSSGDDKGEPVGLLKGLSKGSLDEARMWANSFNEKLLDEINQDNFRQIFNSNDKFISEASSLSIYFVFVPDEKQIEEIGQWLRKSLNNQKLIFSVKVDPSLIGGCAIAYKGVYKDYSLRAKIGANKEKLVEEFRRYLKQW